MTSTGYKLSSSDEVLCVTESVYSAAVPTCDGERFDMDHLGALWSRICFVWPKSCSLPHMISIIIAIFCSVLMMNPSAQNCATPKIANGKVTNEEVLQPGKPIDIACNGMYFFSNKYN